LAEEKLFVRKATGLVREIGLLTSIIITLSYTIGLGWQKRIFQFSGKAIVPSNKYLFGINPMVMAFLLVGVVVLFSIYAFGAMTAAMPRSGGGYVTISRVVHPYVGYMGAWLEYLATAVSFGLIAVAVMEVVIFLFPSLIGFNNSWWTASANSGYAEAALIGIGALVVAIFTGIAVFGVSLTGKLLQAMFWVPAILTVSVYGFLISSTPAALTAGLSTIYSVSDPAKVTQSALSQGMASSFTGGYWGAVFVATLGAYWAYEGYAASTFVAGEIKEANRNLPRSLFIAAIIIVAVYTTASALLYHSASSVGSVTQGGNTYSFFDAWSWMSYGNSTALSTFNTATGAQLPKAWLPFDAAGVASGIGAGWFLPALVIFALFWVMNDIPPFILAGSRIMFAMSFDRILPSKLANVNEKYHSPIWAIVVTGIIAFVGVLGEAEGDYSQIANFSPALSSIVAAGVPTTDLWDMAFFALFALTAIILPFRRKDIYDRSPFKPQIGKLPLLAVIGAIAFLGNVVLMGVELYTPSGYDLKDLWTASPGGLFDPAAFNSGASSPFWFTIALLIFLTLFYVAYRARNRKAGVNYQTIYTQIPPE
jgi:amino acid transporter